MSPSIAQTSPLDAPPAHLADRPFFAQTVELLRCVRDHDLESLSALCDDDFGIVDAGPDGQPVAVRTREEWTQWFVNLFATLDAMEAATDSEITDYQVLETADMAMSVVDFVQYLDHDGARLGFTCQATIVWKRTESGWKEARWHVSILSSPETAPQG